MLKSKLNIILIPATLLIVLCCGVLLFIVYIIIINNLSNLNDPGIISMILFISWIAIFPSIMMFSLIKNYHISDEHLEVKYLFGLLTHRYQYSELKISDYTWSTKGLLIELPNSDQLTIGERQYKNYSTIKEALEERIVKEEIKVRYTTRFTRTMFIIGGLTLLFLVISLQLGE